MRIWSSNKESPIFEASKIESVIYCPIESNLISRPGYLSNRRFVTYLCSGMCYKIFHLSHSFRDVFSRSTVKLNLCSNMLGMQNSRVINDGAKSVPDWISIRSKRRKKKKREKTKLTNERMQWRRLSPQKGLDWRFIIYQLNTFALTSRMLRRCEYKLNFSDKFPKPWTQINYEYHLNLLL